MRRFLLFLVVVSSILASAFDAVGQGCTGAEGVVRSSSGKLDFGSVNIGSSKSLGVRLSNASTSTVLKISSLTALDSQFSVTSPKALPVCLSPGEFLDITVVFAPTQNGPIDSKLRISSSYRGSPDFIFLFGTGTGSGSPNFVASPSSLDFGSVQAGKTSSKSFTIANQGNLAGTITQITISNNAFFVSSPVLPRNVAPGSQFAVNLIFAPGKAGAFNATVSIRSGAAVVDTVSLTGTGTQLSPDIAISPQSLNFGNIDVGTFGTKSLGISNSGGGDLEVKFSAGPHVSLSPPGPLVIKPGKSAQVKVQCTADQLGPINNSLNLQTNDPDQKNLNVALEATGVAGKFGLLNVTTKSKIGNNNNESSGVQWVDYNGDGKQDIYITGLDGNLLFKNLGGGKFMNATGPSRLGNSGRNSPGASWGDVDNDGDPDLFIANANGPSAVLKNNNGAFANQGSALGLFAADNTPASQGGIWLDFNNDGRLDLFVVKDGRPNQLFKQTGIFRFTDVASSAGLALNGPGRSAVAADFNNDGFSDLYVAQFQKPNRLYLNNKNETFRDVTQTAGVGFNGASEQAAVTDYDGDGDFDIFVANSDGTSVLYRNMGSAKFQNATGAAGLAGPKKAKAATFTDYDNDGDQDLLIVQAQGQNTVYRNNGNGKFTRLANVDITTPDNPTSTSSGDADNDGTPDSVIVDGDSSSQNGDTLYDNTGGAGNNWLVLILEGTQSNRSAIGAKVILRAGAVFQAKTVTGGNGQSQDSLPLEFGLGSANVATSIIISWPGGRIQSLENVPANQRLKITEPAN